MRFRQMATYRGAPYEAGVGPSESDVVLFSALPPPEGLGFEPTPGHWRKRVIRAEVDVLWESRPIGTFHGEACLVLDDLGDRLHIVYLGKDARRARELGFWPVDRGVFELLTPRDEVTSLTEEKVEKSLPRTRPDAGGPPRPSYPYGAQPWAAAPSAAPAPDGARGRGYPAEPALAPAGGWTGNGSPPRNAYGPGGPGGYGRSGRPENWTGPGTGPQPTAGSRPPDWTGPGTGPQPTAGSRPPDWTGPGTEPQPTVGGYGTPAGPSTWTGNGTPPPGPDWAGHGAQAPPPAWTGNGAPPPGASWAGPGTPADWHGNGGPVPAGGWHGSGASGHGAANRAGGWNGVATATQAPPGGPDSILDGTPLAGPPRRRRPPRAGRRSARKQRVQTRSIFSELADLAAIPRSAYALEHESDGAMCLLRTGAGFEVFSAADGARHEVRTFEDEEAAYFYLFGVLAAEAVRNGSLIPPR